MNDLDLALAMVEGEARGLEMPQAYERASVLRGEAALLLDRLLCRVARGRGALDVAIGEGLAALGVGDRALRLGFSGLGDYGRERLGISASEAIRLARLARELRDRPLLRDAVCSGEVSRRKAETVLLVARGEDEARWVERAKRETVRALKAAVREARSGEDAEPEEAWERVVIPVSESARPKLEEAMELAGKLLGATATRAQRLEWILAEYLAEHPVEGGDEVFHGPAESWLERFKLWLEEESGEWAFLEPPRPVRAPELVEEQDAFRLDEELRRLVAKRKGWDELLGRLAMMVRGLGLWRDMKFVSFAHYCDERVGLSVRAVEQRIRLERRMTVLPELREALREGRLSYEQARLVGDAADERTVAAWIERAEGMTCIELQREVEAEDAAQMCASRVLDLRVPARVAEMLGAAFRTAREAAGRWLRPEECFEMVLDHFLATYRGAFPERKTFQRQVMERDRGLCQAPGCSRAAAHVHHIVYRSRLGENETHNGLGLCAGHHLHGIHHGYLKVSGRAPDELVWSLGVRAGRAPLMVSSPQGGRLARATQALLSPSRCGSPQAA